jgi:lactoylglutathione lyase
LIRRKTVRIHHIALLVKDLEISKIFYEEMFGFKENLRISFQDEEIIFLEQNGMMIELITNNQGISHSDQYHICFEVEDVDLQINRFAVYSLQPSEGPYALKNGWKTVFFRGPDQEVIELLQIE